MQTPYPELARTADARLEQVDNDIRSTPEVAGFQSYESFVNNSAKQKAAFLAGEIRNPSLHYPRLEGEALEELGELANGIPGTESVLVTLMGSERTDRTEAMYDTVEYRHCEIFMTYMAARMNDESLSVAERAEAAVWFKLANEALFGVPENKLFSAIARERLLVHLDAESDDPQVWQLQQEVRERIGEITDEGYERHQPLPENQQRFNRIVRTVIDGLIDHVQPRHDGEQQEILYQPDDMVRAFTEVLDKMGATELGWQCQKIPSKDLMAVSAHRKLVEIGEDREPMTASELRGKIGHELIHALRSVIAERAGWLAAAYGAPRYLDAEESFANKVGAAYWDGEAVAGPEYRYLIDSFSYGLDNHEPRDMRDCFEIMWRTIALDRRKPGEPLDIARAQDIAYLQCTRMFRSTPCDIPGLTYNKDLAYARGDEVINPIIDLIEDEDDFELMLAGKLDPSLPDHLAIAEKIKPGTNLARRIREFFALAA